MRSSDSACNILKRSGSNQRIAKLNLEAMFDGSYMKWIIFLGLAFVFSSCFGISEQDRALEYQLRYEKRVDCTQTKNTSESANITQCPKVRPDTNTNTKPTPTDSAN